MLTSQNGSPGLGVGRGFQRDSRGSPGRAISLSPQTSRGQVWPSWGQTHMRHMSSREPLHSYQEACYVCECSSCGHQDGHGPVAPVAHAVVEVPGGRRAEVRPPLSQGSRAVSALRKLQVGNHKQPFPALYRQSVFPLSTVKPTSSAHSESKKQKSPESPF